MDSDIRLFKLRRTVEYHKLPKMRVIVQIYGFQLRLT